MNIYISENPLNTIGWLSIHKRKKRVRSVHPKKAFRLHCCMFCFAVKDQKNNCHSTAIESARYIDRHFGTMIFADLTFQQQQRDDIFCCTLWIVRVDWFHWNDLFDSTVLYWIWLHWTGLDWTVEKICIHRTLMLFLKFCIDESIKREKRNETTKNT